MTTDEYFNRLNDGQDTIARIEDDHREWRARNDSVLNQSVNPQSDYDNEPPDCDDIYDFLHCPCCGRFTSTRGGNYADEPQQDYCPDCGWEVDVDYP